MNERPATEQESTQLPAGPSGFQPDEKIPLKWLVLRVFLVAVQLILAYWLSWQSQPFFYQRF